jgi:hypothetical protein
MKLLVNLLLLNIFLTVSIVGKAQASEKGLRLGAIVGTQYNDFSKGFGTAINPQVYSFTLGAGASYLYKRLIVGGEFYQSSARKTNANESLQYVGSVTNILIGYCPFQRGASRIETSIGFGFSNNQLIGQADDNTRFQNVYNNQFSINPSLVYANVGANGLCWGLKLSYSAGVAGHTKWKYRSSGEASVFNSDVNAVVLQFTVGGVVDLLKGDQ